MKILLTNDDGIGSRGVRALVKALSPLARLWVCVPEKQQSATSHSITVREPLWVRQERIEGAQEVWCVDGRPADCVKIALLHLLAEPADLVISGINEGSNLGTDTLYSGTVGAAMEGALNGIPAMAVSLAVNGKDEESWDFGPAAEVAADLYKRWEAGALPIGPGSVLNVNIPDLPAGGIKGYKAARLGIQRYSDAYQTLERGESGQKYLLRGERLPSREKDLALDIVALEEGFVALTPLCADRTDNAGLAEIGKIFAG